MAESFYELTGGQRNTGFVKAMIQTRANDDDITQSMLVKKPYSKKSKDKAVRFVQSLGVSTQKPFKGQSNTLDGFLEGGCSCMKGGYVTGHMNASKRILDKYGNSSIWGMKVVRTPLSSGLNRLLNIMSLGKMKRMKNKHEYNDYFHLFLVVDIGNNRNIVIEKNERVSISQTYKKEARSQEMNVPYDMNRRSITVNELVNTTLNKIGEYNFWQYRAFSLNCQRFIKDILQSNGLLNNQLESFIMQPVESIAKQMSPGFKKIANFATDAAGYVSKLFGRGKKKVNQKASKAMKLATVLRGKGYTKQEALKIAWQNV